MAKSRALARPRRFRTRTRYVRAVGHRAKKMTLPLAMLAGFVPLGGRLFTAGKLLAKGDYDGAGRYASLYVAGWDVNDKKFRPSALVNSWAPLVAGMMMHKVANRLGVNRAIASAGIPIIRI